MRLLHTTSRTSRAGVARCASILPVTRLSQWTGTNAAELGLDIFWIPFRFIEETLHKVYIKGTLQFFIYEKGQPPKVIKTRRK